MIVSATHEARHAATAASAALPPAARISAPASAVAGWPAATAGEILSANAFGESAPETAKAFEWEVEPLALTLSLGDLERALTNRTRCELTIVQFHRKTADCEVDFDPGVAVGVGPGEPITNLVGQVDRRRHASSRPDHPFEEQVLEVPQRLATMAVVRQADEDRVAVGDDEER